MPTLRTYKGSKRYYEYQKGKTPGAPCVLCAKNAEKEFTFFKITKNDFPYDRIAKKHDMIMSKNHKEESSLSKEEIDELNTIKENYINDNYDYIVEAVKKNKSLPRHFHLHLLLAK